MIHRNGWRAWMACAATVVALLAPVSAWAQVSTANIGGTVKDESGAVLPGVNVAVINSGNGARRDTVTAENGTFRVQALQPGTYEVQAEMTGFNTFAQKGVVLEVGQDVTITIDLKVGGLAETVAVTADSPLVETTKSSLGQVVETRQIQNLPLNGRNFQDLAVLVPGARPSPSVDTTKSRGVFKAIAFGAQSGRMTNVSIDGGDIGDTAVGSTTLGYPLDAIQEFNVVTNRFTAEFGRSSTAAVSVITRSGSNDFRGLAYGYFRDKALNSKTYFERQAGVEKPDFERQQMGATFGGPIQKDKTHFFAAYERQNEKTNAFTNTQGAFPQFDGVVATPYRLDLFTTKVDRQINKDQSMFVRYAFHDDDVISNVGNFSPLEAGSAATNRTHDTVVGHTWVMSTSTVNELRVHYGDFHNQENALSQGTRLSYNNLNLGSNPNDPQSVRQRRLQIRDDISRFVPDWHGQHSLKAGVDYTRVRFDSLFATNQNGTFVFPHNNYPFNAANPATFPNRYSVGFGDPNMNDYNTNFVSLYVQDDWKPTSRLTFNLGLRWDAELNNAGTLQNAFSPYKAELGEQKNDLNNLAPRLGFVWDTKGDGRTVVRGGYGIYYFLTILNATLNSYLFDGQRYVTITVDNLENRADFYTNPLGGKTPQEFASSNPFNTRLMDPDYATPYSQQSTIGVSQQIGKDIALDVDYVHILGLREATGRDINLFGVNGGQTGRDGFGIPTPRPYPQFRQVLMYDTNGRSLYDGLHVGLRKRYSNRYSTGVSYTLSRAKGRLPSGFGSVANDQTDIDADYGYQATDERHRIAVNAIVELPWKLQVAPIVQFSTGRPYTLVQTGIDPNNDTRTGDRAEGKERSSERGTKQFQADVRIAREFALGHNMRLQAMFEVFNITNHDNFSSFNGNVRTPANIGLPGVVADPRQAQVGVKFMF